MKKNFIYIVLLIFALSFNNSLADDVETSFNKANQYYQKGEFNKAIESYKKIIDNGFYSTEVFYNLGNSFYRIKKYPNAILYYEKAKRLNPSDEDIEFNLKIANLSIVDKIEPLPKFFFLMFISISLFLYLFSPGLKKVFFSTAIISLVLTIISFTFAYQMYNSENSHNQAIVFTPTVSVKSSPDYSGTDIFVLHEGTKVQILDNVGQWKKIKIANGNIGWILAKQIEII